MKLWMGINNKKHHSQVVMLSLILAIQCALCMWLIQPLLLLIREIKEMMRD